jgi:hypothetical protein
VRYQRFRASARLAVTLLLALSALAGMFHGRRTARAFHEDTQLTEFERAEVNILTDARTDGTTVVWNESHHAGEADAYRTWHVIAGARLHDRQRFEIARTPATIGDNLLYYPPDVDGSLVAWSSLEITGTPDAPLWAARVTGAWLNADGSVGTPFEIAASQPAAPEDSISRFSVRVTGEWVVWTQASSTLETIMARNVVSMADPVVLTQHARNVAQDDPPLGAPEVDAGWVVWSVPNAPGVPVGQEQFVAYALDDPRAMQQFVEPASYSYDFKGGVFVSLLDFTGDYEHPGTQGVLVRTLDGAERRLLFSFPAPYTSGSIVRTDGRYVYMSYSLRLSGSTCCDFRTLAYDLQTDSVFPVLDKSGSGVTAENEALVWIEGYYASTRKVINATSRADRLPSAPVLDTREPSADYTYFPATQHYLSYGFKAAWEQWGGLPVFGYPLTEEYQAIGADGSAHAAQYLERQRFEWHPENTGTPYEVELGRLGAELLAAQGRDWLTFPRADPSTPNYYAVTGHAIAPEFAAYWSGHGLEFGDPGVSYRESLALFGYPISEPMLETNADGANVLTQYFERAVFEYHPENTGSYTVLLRRVGAEALAARGW